MMNAIYEEAIKREHEKRAKKHIIKEREKELIAQGIDKTIAEVMAKVEFEYNI